MAASVRIEDEAFSDGRFENLGRLLGTSRYDALGRMAFLWKQCTQEGVYILPVADVELHIDVTKLVTSRLAEITPKGIRIKGTKGRVEWLKKKRKTARKGGLARARGSQRLAGKFAPAENQHMAGTHTSAPAPASATASATALKTEQTSSVPPLPPELDTPEFREAWSAWVQHRKEIKKPLKPTATAQQLRRLARLGPERAIAAIQFSVANGWTGIFEPGSERGSAKLGDVVREEHAAFLERGES